MISTHIHPQDNGHLSGQKARQGLEFTRDSTEGIQIKPEIRVTSYCNNRLDLKHGNLDVKPQEYDLGAPSNDLILGGDPPDPIS